ncbi:hypothetical protein COCC4DRAFT_32344 [Bipolaris maydis ATCC 48331]|uniref:Uncharacterized protein n=2 Tax=Cochliobolus heterostrophus TaxID=5016 RepID=M2UZ39_COCH5|nr:uncharacterized protein COCC4DRAFT_32344 [Bipolaris maydis ATCC 48331]EMD92997.1 hypothetical protein COCHEDRAFT_1020841 [Bipolaris maydis C5]ENI04616.1 hypothetical protein COCC4DRAFT_32344 [Bipolaris maydis ATCC 48331]
MQRQKAPLPGGGSAGHETGWATQHFCTFASPPPDCALLLSKGKKIWAPVSGCCASSLVFVSAYDPAYRGACDRMPGLLGKGRNQMYT